MTFPPNPSPQPSSVGSTLNSSTVDIPLVEIAQESELRNRVAYAAPQSPVFVSSLERSDSSRPLLTGTSSTEGYLTEFPVTTSGGMAATALAASDSSSETIPIPKKKSRFTPCVEIGILVLNLLAVVAAVLTIVGFVLYPKPPSLEPSSFTFQDFSIKGVGTGGNAFQNGVTEDQVRQLATNQGWQKIFGKVAQQSPPYQLKINQRFNFTVRSASSIGYPLDQLNYTLRLGGNVLTQGALQGFQVPRQGNPTTLNDVSFVTSRTFDSLPALLNDPALRSLLMSCGVMDIISSDIQNPKNPTFVVLSLAGQGKLPVLKAVSWSGAVSDFVSYKPQRIGFTCPTEQIQRLLSQ